MTVAATVAKPVALTAPQRPPSAPESAPGPKDSVSVEGVGSFLGQAAASAGGAAGGYVVANLAAGATRTMGGLAAQFVLGAMPNLQIAPALAQLLNNGLALGIGGGALLAAGAGIAAGAVIAGFAASGAEKIDAAMKPQVESKGAFKNLMGGLRDDGAIVRADLAGVHNAKSLKEAAGEGFDAGATFGGRVGMYAGKVQGTLMGAAVGTVASLPLVAAVNTLVALPLPAMAAVALPVALIGASLGGKLGEATGQALGGVAGGAVGAAGAAVYHGAHSLIGGGKEG